MRALSYPHLSIICKPQKVPPRLYNLCICLPDPWQGLDEQDIDDPALLQAQEMLAQLDAEEVTRMTTVCVCQDLQSWIYIK